MVQAPTPAQRVFLALEGREALYGGAAGGGKSSALLMAALQYVDVPGYAALLLRRKYTDLTKPEALMDRADQWLRGTDAKWNENKKQWRFPSGAVLAFGYLEHEADKFQYQGAAYQFIGFDELTQFSETQFRYLFSRMRRLEGASVPIRMRAASNPGGIGHQWVRQRFLVEGAAVGRVFVPAKLEDNPHLDRDEYEKSLEELDPITRAQLRRGDWSVRDKDNALVPEWTEELAERVVREWQRPSWVTSYSVGDLGSRDLTVWLLAYWDFEAAKLVVVDEVVLKDPSTWSIITSLRCQEEESLPETDELHLDTHRRLSDVDYRLVQDFRAAGLDLTPTKKDDALGARNRARAMLARGDIIIHPRCKVLLLTLESAVWNEKRTDYLRAPGTTGHADAWDALVYLVRNVDQTRNPVPVRDIRLGEKYRTTAVPMTQAARQLKASMGPSKRKGLSRQ